VEPLCNQGFKQRFLVMLPKRIKTPQIQAVADALNPRRLINRLYRPRHDALDAMRRFSLPYGFF
jgi:hypothetical protein